MKSAAIEKYRKIGKIGKIDGKNLLLCYERILGAAVKHEATTIERCLSLLEESLDYKPNPKLGMHLFRLYQYMRGCLARDQYDEICRVTETLKRTWEQAIALDARNDGIPIPNSEELAQLDRTAQS